MNRPSKRDRGIVRDAAGITLPELMIGIVVMSIATAFALTGYEQYRESAATSRAVRVISADVALARSLAIRAREPVSLVARENLRRYVIRDTSGALFQRRDFGTGAEIELTGIDVATTGDSLTFDSRGVLITGGTPRVDAIRHGRTRSVTFNALGRGVIN